MSTIKNNPWLSIITLLLLAANITTLVLLWAEKKHSNGGNKFQPASGPVFEFLTRELKLNEQQRSAYAKLRDKHQVDIREVRDSMRQAKDALFSLLQQPTVADSLVQEFSRKANSFDQQVDVITFRHFQQVRAICDPAQQKKFDEIIKTALSRMAGPGGHPPGHGNHPPPPDSDRSLPDQP